LLEEGRSTGLLAEVRGREGKVGGREREGSEVTRRMGMKRRRECGRMYDMKVRALREEGGKERPVC